MVISGPTYINTSKYHSVISGIYKFIPVISTRKHNRLKRPLWLRYYIYCKIWFSEHAPIWSLTMLNQTYGRTAPKFPLIHEHPESFIGYKMPIVCLLFTETILKKTRDVEQDQRTYTSVATDLISSGVYRPMEVFFQNIILGSFQPSSLLPSCKQDLTQLISWSSARPWHCYIASSSFPLFLHNEVTILPHTIRHEKLFYRHFMYYWSMTMQLTQVHWLEAQEHLTWGVQNEYQHR